MKASEIRCDVIKSGTSIFTIFETYDEGVHGTNYSRMEQVNRLYHFKLCSSTFSYEILEYFV